MKIDFSESGMFHILSISDVINIIVIVEKHKSKNIKKYQERFIIFFFFLTKKNLRVDKENERCVCTLLKA